MTTEADDTAAVVRDAYDLHYGAMVGWADQLLQDSDLAYEVVTDAYAKLLRQDKHPDDVRPALYAQIVHAVLDTWRHEGEDLVRVVTRPDNPSADTRHSARSAGRAMPVRVRESFLLHWYAALTVPEIVAATSSSRRSVERDLADAKDVLRSRFDDVTDEEIEEFFVAQRAAVRPMPGGPDHWEQIVHQAEQERSLFWPVAAVLGVLALVMSVWSFQQNPFGDSGVHAANEVDGSVTHAPSGSASDELTRSEPQSPRSVPTTFVPWSVSNAGNGTLFSVGSTSCGAEEVCPTVLRSTNNGTSWRAVHSFDRTDTASVTSDEVPRIQPNRAITEVEFADPKIGFAFGGDLWRTRDGGRSFESVPLPDPKQTVLDVAVDQDDVVVLTADGCSQGRCAGPLMVSRAKVDAKAISQPVTALELADDRPIDSGQLVLAGGNVFVQPYRVAGNLDSPWRLEGKELISMRPGSTCGNNPLQALTATANGTPTLYSLCGGDLRGNQAEYQLMRSTDDGKDWAPATGTKILLPRIGRLSLAATDEQHHLVAAGGPRKVAGPTRVQDPSRLLQATTDGGKHWKPVTKPEVPPQGMDYVTSPGGREAYAITRTSAAFWRSSDYGKTWHRIDPSRPRPTTSSSSKSSSSH